MRTQTLQGRSLGGLKGSRSHPPPIPKDVHPLVEGQLRAAGESGDSLAKIENAGRQPFT